MAASIPSRETISKLARNGRYRVVAGWRSAQSLPMIVQIGDGGVAVVFVNVLPVLLVGGRPEERRVGLDGLPALGGEARLADLRVGEHLARGHEQVVAAEVPELLVRVRFRSFLSGRRASLLMSSVTRRPVPSFVYVTSPKSACASSVHWQRPSFPISRKCLALMQSWN